MIAIIFYLKRGYWTNPQCRLPNIDFLLDRSRSDHYARRASAHVAEPATTRNVPATLRTFRCSGATRLGANFPTIHMPATVNSGDVDSTALKRETSHRLRPSAKAPY